MATIFTTGTINQPDAGSVGLTMVERIRDDVIAHAAWDLVEEFTAGSGLVRWYVLKCLASQSGLPNDFFVVISRTLGSGELRFFLCEGYTAGTHTMQYFATPSNTSSVTFDSAGRTTPTYVLSTAVPSFPGQHIWAPSGVSTKWWIIVTEDSFAVAFNGASNGFFQAGAYVPLSSVAVPMPICSISHDQSGYITRNPTVAGISATGGALWVLGGGTNTGTNLLFLGIPGRLDANDKLQSDQRPVSELGIVINGWPTQQTFAPVMGYVLGKQKRMRIGQGGTPPAGAAFGDAYVFQSRLWVPYLPTDNRMWDTGVAA